jgi:hypothetical protein
MIVHEAVMVVDDAVMVVDEARLVRIVDPRCRPILTFNLIRKLGELAFLTSIFI